jgi:uncharacterized protein (UPF0332 family)
MSIHAELLEVARDLLDGGPTPGAPNQGRLRRAVSTMYYAYFHFLIEKSVASLTTTPEVRSLASRAYEHEQMLSACKSIAGENLPERVKEVYGGKVDPTLKKSAQLFIDLQLARHHADYKTYAVQANSAARVLLARLEEAIDTWTAIENLPITRIFLVALLVNKQMNRKD